MKKIFIGLAFVLFGGISIFANNQEQFTVILKIYPVTKITNTASLNFGTTKLEQGGLTVNANAGPHPAGATAAAFNVQGMAGVTADVSMVSNTVTFTNGGTNLSVTLFLADPIHVFTGNPETLYVGGSLTEAKTGTVGGNTRVNTGIAQFQMVHQ